MSPCDELRTPADAACSFKKLRLQAATAAVATAWRLFFTGNLQAW